MLTQPQNNEISVKTNTAKNRNMQAEVKIYYAYQIHNIYEQAMNNSDNFNIICILLSVSRWVQEDVWAPK